MERKMNKTLAELRTEIELGLTVYYSRVVGSRVHRTDRGYAIEDITGVNEFDLFYDLVDHLFEGEKGVWLTLNRHPVRRI
jgi:hypothetical protein